VLSQEIIIEKPREKVKYDQLRKVGKSNMDVDQR
jgi:hypothetical protein